MEQRRLADAGGTDHRQHLAAFDLQIEIFENLNGNFGVAVRLRQAASLEEGHARRRIQRRRAANGERRAASGKVTSCSTDSFVAAAKDTASGLQRAASSSACSCSLEPARSAQLI